MKKLSLILCLILSVVFGGDLLATGRVNVISLNLRTVTASKKDGIHRWDNRKASIVRMLKKESPDIVGTQEGYLCQIDYLSDNCPGYSRVGVGRDDGIEAGEFCSIFYKTSRFDLVSSGNFWLSDTPETPSKGWDEKYYRIVTWARLRELKSGKEVIVFNTHYPLSKLAQEKAMKVLTDHIAELSHSIPVILCADWNMSLDNPVLQPLLERFSDLRTSFRNPDERPTYNAFGKKPAGLIDHIFFNGLRPVSYKNLDGNYGVQYISDHYPIKGIFRL